MMAAAPSDIETSFRKRLSSSQGIISLACQKPQQFFFLLILHPIRFSLLFFSLRFLSLQSRSEPIRWLAGWLIGLVWMYAQSLTWLDVKIFFSPYRNILTCRENIHI